MSKQPYLSWHTIATWVGAVVLAVATRSPAHPDAAEQVKFEQLPMISTLVGDAVYTGHDEESRAGIVEHQNGTNFYAGNAWMADDFADRVSEPVVHVEWWGSYMGEVNPSPTTKFLIEFLSDYPTNSLQPFSRPATQLLAQVLFYQPGTEHPEPGFYTEMMVPGTDVYPEPIFYYNAHLRVPFPQEADTVYWMKIVALVDDPTRVWGWHNRDYTVMNPYASTNVVPGERIVGIVAPAFGAPAEVWHFQDNAVQGNQIAILTELLSVAPDPEERVLEIREWETNAVPAHYQVPFDGPEQIQNFSKDLAFRLYHLPPPEAKWRQPLDTDNGIDIASYLDIDTFYYLADDFISDGRPITGFRWWGSYLNYKTNQPGPVAPPQGVERPVRFHLGWWTDVPAGTDTDYSHPGDLILAQGHLLYPLGPVMESYATSVWHEAGGWTHEFLYELAIPEIDYLLNEKRDGIYWLSIQADYYPRSPTNGWGWATTRLENGWNDDAVRGAPPYPPTTWDELRYDDVWPGHPYGTQSVDMAFELLTDVIGRRGLKWRQPPDMYYGENLPSWRYPDEPEGLPLRADDFVSDGRRITDVHWWGSYIGYETNWFGQTAPPPPTNTASPLGFMLSWHADIPTNATQTFSMPSNPPLREIFVPIERCHEVYYGTVYQFWKTGGQPPLVQEHEYQYYVDLLDPALGAQTGAWYEVNNVVYWLNVQAVFTNAWSPADPMHDGWGWKTTPVTNRWNDVSVVATTYGSGGPEWMPGAYPPGHPMVEFAPDLAFELTTDEAGSNRWHGPVWITNFVATSTNDYRIDSVGDWGSGVQVLQVSTNLLTNLWTDVSTNVLPLPSPYPNIWYRYGPTRSNEFFRVIQR